MELHTVLGLVNVAAAAAAFGIGIVAICKFAGRMGYKRARLLLVFVTMWLVMFLYGSLKCAEKLGKCVSEELNASGNLSGQEPGR